MKIVIGGQVDRQKIADKVVEITDSEVEVEVMDDIQAATAIKTGAADYYFGACHTGGGGALGMAMAILTSAKCATISMPGRGPKEEKIIEELEAGKVAFGFTADHIDKAVTLLIKNILN
ncbi:DUF2620 family protein [Halanaerobium salsuginis]|jgi:hypothetical protein|uniref:DUF2620 domain-containing protein n=1 Tax=Halanaerobium salsuginis TaxID=29563 RepID=A0A1I4GS85_9FIRM|nr:DUF2620 family protein [Halanaerobium salsuginis]SFL32845.1 Protein of unknown function DUF2620 [Halanaerobium salsuginis]